MASERDKARCRAWYRANKARHRAVAKAADERRKKSDPARWRTLQAERTLRYRRRHRAKVLAYYREYSKGPKGRATQKRYRAKHKDKLRKQHAAWCLENYEHRRVTQAAHIRRYQALHPEVLRAAKLRRRARERGAMGDIRAVDVKTLIRSQDGRCHYCERRLQSYHLDHNTPLSRGGASTRRNIVAACPRCNWRKNNKTAAEFRRYMKRVGV